MPKSFVIKICKENPLDLDKVFTSGQVFGWRKIGNSWAGVLRDIGIILSQQANILKVKVSKGLNEEEIKSYLTLDLDFSKVKKTFPNDKFLNITMQSKKGLRLVRQDMWECLASYICATYSNIKRIEKNLYELRIRFGEKVDLDDIKLFTFPPPDRIANSKIRELRHIGLGFRADYLRDTAREICKGTINLSKIKELSYEKAWEELVYSKHLKGVGAKVADCVLLYSMDKFEAFPIDVRISKLLAKNYGELIGKENVRKLERRILSLKTYFDISKKVRAYFGPFSGLCQLYLYSFSRSSLLC
jgi:N-glycosylase/DNA lyase